LRCLQGVTRATVRLHTGFAPDRAERPSSQHCRARVGLAHAPRVRASDCQAGHGNWGPVLGIWVRPPRLAELPVWLPLCSGLLTAEQPGSCRSWTSGFSDCLGAHGGLVHQIARRWGAYAPNLIAFTSASVMNEFQCCVHCKQCRVPLLSLQSTKTRISPQYQLGHAAPGFHPVEQRTARRIPQLGH
jgi:hypothetical protein